MARRLFQKINKLTTQKKTAGIASFNVSLIRILTITPRSICSESPKEAIKANHGLKKPAARPIEARI